jgi:hypothetical protein
MKMPPLAGFCTFSGACRHCEEAILHRRGNPRSSGRKAGLFRLSQQGRGASSRLFFRGGVPLIGIPMRLEAPEMRPGHAGLSSGAICF